MNDDQAHEVAMQRVERDLSSVIERILVPPTHCRRGGCDLPAEYDDLCEPCYDIGCDES